MTIRNGSIYAITSHNHGTGSIYAITLASTKVLLCFMGNGYIMLSIQGGIVTNKLHTTTINKVTGEIKSTTRAIYGCEVIDGDIVSARTLKGKLLEMINEWNRIAVTNGGDLFWHYHLELVP